MKTPTAPMIAILCSLATTSACVIYDPPPPFGDIAFDWSFDGIPTCDEAGVDEVDVAIFQDGELVLDHQGEPCQGGGLVFTDIHTGTYEVFIDAYDRNGVVLYSGDFSITVEAGVVNDAGVVVLDAVNAPDPPTVEVGSLAFFWVFPYPGEALTFDCALAGVDEVDVTVTPAGSAVAAYQDTFACDAEGVEVTNLPAGRYQLRVQAFGEYHQEPILLFDSGSLDVDIFGNELTSLEDLIVARADNVFSDFDVSWSFVDESCLDLGVESVTVSFQRFGFAAPEDSLAVDCGAAGVLRRVFVPGSYDVSVAAIGSDDVTYLGATTVDVPPNTVADVDLVLVLAG
jgi:hypothetical protein